jgi:peptide deformylase
VTDRAQPENRKGRSRRGKGRKARRSRPAETMSALDHPLTLRLLPDPVLRELCQPVIRFDSVLRDLLDEMLLVMRANNGIGLAGPQVGVTRRVLVSEIQGNTICLVNPVIRSRSGGEHMVEGCLSLPGIGVAVERSTAIEIRGYDTRGRIQELEARGLWARVIQHEIDHLDGRLIVDHGSPEETAPGESAPPP